MKFSQSEFILDEQMAKSVILYVCHKLENNPKFGSIVLNKALYYIDRTAFLHFGKPLMGFTYVKQKEGPTPAPGQFLPIRAALEREGSFKLVSREYFGRIQSRPVIVRTPQVWQFDPDSLRLLDEIIDQVGEMNGAEVSSFSHQEIAWQHSEMFEEMPYFTYLASEAPMRADSLDWARAAIEEHAAATANH